MPKMVDDVLVHWDQMTGKTDLHKQVNALLTAMMILRHDVPADECESEAAVVLGFQGMVAAGEWEMRVLWFLKERFAVFKSADGGKEHKSERFARLCDTAAPLIFRLCEHIGPMDLEKLLANNGTETSENR